MHRVNCGQRRSKGDLENNSRKPRDLNRPSGNLKKSQFTLSQGMMKKGGFRLLLLMMMMRQEEVHHRTV